MPVSHYHRTIFVHVPKTAGTSIELALGIRHREDGSEFYPLRLYGRQLQHHTAAEMRHQIFAPHRYQAYFTFAFVRNPWDRLVSSYQFFKNAKVIDCSFDTFASMDFLSRKDFPKYVFDHIRPQTDYILDNKGQLLVNFLGYYERLHEDWAKISDRLGLSDAALPLSKKSQRGHYLDYYNERTKQAVAEFYAKDISYLGYCDKKVRNIFIDCGANDGRSCLWFRRHKDPAGRYHYYVFEPHPAFRDDLNALESKLGAPCVIHEACAWTEYGESVFYVDDRETWHGRYEGSSLFSSKTSGNMDRSKALHVKTVDFDHWFNDTFAHEDNIVLKLDCEGAEYPLLESMLKSGSIYKINAIYIEWHWNKIAEITREKHDSILQKLKETGVDLYEWVDPTNEGMSIKKI